MHRQTQQSFASSQQEQQITSSSSSQQQVTQQYTEQRRTEQHVTRHVTTSQQQQRVQGMVLQQTPNQPAFGGRPVDISPPVFEQIFRNARFAQGGNALFEGKVQGTPRPVVSWTRKSAPLFESNKYKMTYEEQTGNVSLLINHIGPGDEGEYTCTARNQYGEAICSVYIQPEGQAVPTQPSQSYHQQQQQQTQQHFQQTNGTTSYSNGHTITEDFKVDTFEYRILREVSFRESLTRRFVGESDVELTQSTERGPVAPPQIQQKPRNSKLAEGSNATFQAKISANPKPRLTWFKNGQRITQSSKYVTSFSNQQATLQVTQAGIEDSGHYTLLAENPQGCVVSSAYLAIEAAGHDMQQEQRESLMKTSRVETVTAVESTESAKALAPNFVRVCNDRDATEGKMTRFDCRVTGRPYPEVGWFINGRLVADDNTHKILVNESGNHALMITNVGRLDAGVVQCVARNKSGETSFQCTLNVIEKEQVVAPKFVERFTTVSVKEGEPVVLNARAVGTPTPRISWQKDGIALVSTPDMRITVEGGASTLDIARAKASDAAWYQCTAQNVAGSTASRARLFIEQPKGSTPQPRRLNLPRPSKVIEPELAPGPEVIYLRHVERAKPHAPQSEADRSYPPPQFILPLRNMAQVEGGRIHFEARIEPVGDPTMIVEWFINGHPLAASSRATSTFRFGFIALDLISVIFEDSGEYVCRVTSASGSVESQALLSVSGRAGIEQTSQHPDSLQYISQLEDYSRYQRTESIEEIAAQRPTFIRPLQELGELQEGRNAHFEGQLTPVSDPTMKVEWYKDGKPITASSRTTTIFNFGYVSLNILHLRAEDAGTYTVRALNRLGEAISQSSLRVFGKTGVTTDLGIPEQQRYIEKVEQLEAYQLQQHQRSSHEAPESTSPPEFKSPIKDQLNIREGGFAHFEARLEPIGDSTLRVEWLKDGRPVEASSRITTFFNFGYVALTIKYVTVRDIGTYSCRAYNTLGQATTTAQMTVVSRKDVIMDSQHPGGLEKIQYLEDSSRSGRSVHEETTVTQQPRFLGPLKGTNKIVEGQRAHFEARVEPLNDMTMQIEWYFNGRVIQSANRIQAYHDFGYVALDIVSVRSDDAGQYTVVARNALGEAQLSAVMEVETRSSIDTSSMHRQTMEKTKQLEGSKFVEPQYHIEEISKSKPIFVQPLSDPKPVSEGKNIHLECRLEPMGDPTMRVEWFYNGRAVTVGSRFRTYYDFGYVALDIVHATALDSGEYTVRATNHLGSAHTSACVRVIDIVTESQNEAALEQIHMLEDSARHRRTVTEDITVVQAPQFTRPLHNVETVEGTNVHLECRLQPVGDPSMRVEWFVNGRPCKTGHRFRPAYDFDYVALDILSVYPVDSGVYTCQARNQLGEAVTSCSVKVMAKKDLILESQHPSGLEKIQYLEDASRYKKTEYMDEVVNIRPQFVTKPKSLENTREGQHAHFECKLEPVTDPNLKVEWYKNGRPVTVGHRFRPIHDFGYVALDIIDLIEEDSATYTCRAVNLVGVDETTCVLRCRGTAQILTNTQNETGLEQIQYLEDRSRYQRSEFTEETTKQAPLFTTSLKNIDIKEGQRAHFECRLIPVSDPSMRVEWFHNNVPVKSGSRFTETNNFGFVALDILYSYPEDSGTYTCRAKNALGEAVTSCSMVSHSKKAILLESQHESALSRLTVLEDSSRNQRQTTQEESVVQAPVFTTPMRELRVAENQAAHFEARLIPVGDPKLRVEWLRNGVAIQASNRVTTMHDFGYVALNMKYVNPEDSGTYTCRAINELGQAVTSATMVVNSKASLLLETQHEGALEKLQMLEDSTKYHRREEEDLVVTQAPRFTTQLNGPTNLVEGQSAHYECRIEPYPDPNLKVEWFHNGSPLQTGHRFRTTADFGFAALDILTVYGEDSGEYTCRATNRLGQASSSIKVQVKTRKSIILDTQHEGALQKIQYLEDDSRYKRTSDEEVVVAEKPQFGRPLKNIENLAEGQSAHLEATLTPVNDPTMKVEWFCNGRPVQQGHRFKTTYDFGFVALDILYAYAEDSGTYMCRARNGVGEAVTTAAVKVTAKSGLYLDTLDAERLKKIRVLENYERPLKSEVEPASQKPVFTTPLVSLEHMKEGEHAHLECRVEPINDPTLKVEWFVNGVAIKTGHRFRTTHDFGYVALDILYAYAEDSGVYMCKATNPQGEAVNTCNVNVASRRSIYLESQHPEGLAKIQELESHGHATRLEVEDFVATPPHFVTQLRGTTDLMEGQTAHFECQVEPLHDPNLRIEFYHDGKPLPSASRFHITFDFGYVALDISHCVPEDAGEYSVKAINALGQCTSTINLRVTAKGSIILDSQRPEGLEKIRLLEGQTPFQRPEAAENVTRQKPVFTQPLQNIDTIAEGQTAHFECRLIPVGDPTLKVEWFRNEKALEDSSRITKTHDFGFVALDMTHVRDDDDAVYMCKASNSLGEAVTTASMKIKSKASIQLETQHPEGMRKIAQLESGHGPARTEEPDRLFEKPVFTQLLTGPAELWEGQHAHFECRVVPVGDPSMRFEWFVNGVELKMGSRFHTTHDFGFVTLDINSVVTADAGVYMCKAINKSGEAVSSTSFKVKSRAGIVGDAIQPDAWQKIQLKEAEMNKVPTMFVDTTPQQAPVFTTHLVNHDKLQEGQHVMLEAQVEPRADPYLRVEWFKNGLPLTTGTRIRSTFDFGFVSLAINGLRADDSAIYTCKATNLLGEAVSTCTLKVEGSHWLLSSSLRPDALPLIESLETPREFHRDTVEPVYELPIFITHLNNVECKEGENVHFECHVEPSKDPTLGIEWFVNGQPLPNGARFKSTYDFGHVSLDINSAYAEDAGVYSCKATNSKGEASTSGSLRCTSKQDIYLDTQHPQGEAGLERVQEAESAAMNKYQRPTAGPEPTFPKPIFIVPLKPQFNLKETEPLLLECQVEPKADPELKVEWFFNSKALEHGSRFKSTCDFGLVNLNLTDVYERDQGVYTCKASNAQGEAFTSTTVYCVGKDNLVEHTQHPKGAEGLEKIQDLEESLRRQEAGLPETDEGHPPVFTSQFQNLKNLSEGEIAHFEASLTPVGDETMTVEWFYNSEVLKASHRTRTVHAFGMVVLEILGTKVEDSGSYTCRATNKWGRAEISVQLECVDKSAGQKPHFTTQIQNLEGLKDGQAAHFECTLVPVGDPNMKVEWFHNGRPMRDATRFKSVSDFGFVFMDISYVQSHDSGEWMCKASNKYGEDYTKATIKCFGKSGVYLDSLQPDSLARIRELEAGASGAPVSTSGPSLEPPKFITHISDVTHLVEGQSAHFEARLTPVNDPDLKVEWFYNDKKLPHGHRYRTFHDFGIVILDILYCYEENSGVYECRAVNKLGSDVTRATLKCVSKSNLILDTQLPQGMEGGLEKIQTLEDSHIRSTDVRSVDVKGQAPMFTVPLDNIDSLREGENAHFEARLTPTDDPKLKVEWFWNGKPLKTGSRFRTFCDFGFVILEISPVYPEDSGEYSCRAFNDYGQAVTTATMKVQGKRSIILESQLPKGMERTIEKIAELEGLGHARGAPVAEDDTGKPPEFITNPVDLTLTENSLAHFECRLVPVNDASMRVEWFHNGKALSAGSRIKTINDFGFVILEVAGVYQRDSGLYTCKATNKHGEATVSCKLQVRGRTGIVMEPQLPSNFRTGTESIQKLEEALYKRDEILATEEEPNPPKFIVELKDVEVQEGKAIHFDCRVEPTSDSSMRIDWFHNGRPFATGSRVHMLNDFGFIVLDMDYVYARDTGEYVCRATNKWGSATTKAMMVCKSKHDIILDSQLPSGMSGEKLKELERGPVSQAPPEEAPRQPPKFITQITSVSVGESEPVHFECRVEPKNDVNLRVEWYRNGKLLPCGHRYRTVFDLGFVSLDILYVYAEDNGEYVCRAYNDLGEDKTRATVQCKKLPSIILQNQVPKGMKKSEVLMQMEATIKKYTSEIHLTEEDLYDADKKQPPRFVTQIKDQASLVEMEATKFECQLAPVGDPNMKVEWFFNGKPLPYKNRFTPIYDFGYVAMNFGWVYPEDSGEYLCRATNLYGMDETRAFIKTAGKPGIIYDSQLPKHMKSIEKIREMEAAWQVAPEENVDATTVKCAPQFVTKPEPFTVTEGECARFCCRVTGWPRPRVMWLINGHTIVNGMRYKLTYDGMWHLDIPKTRQYDHGKIEVVARNSAGEATATTELTVKQREDDYRNVLKNSPRRILGTKEYRKPEWVTHMEELQEALRATQCVPTFVVEIKDYRSKETEAVTFDCQYQGMPVPDIVWYRNDKLISNTKNVKIMTKNLRSTCSILSVTPEDAGTYVCKATSQIGETATKAKLYVQELHRDEKQEFELLKAREEEEKVKMEKIQLEKKRHEKRQKKGTVTFEEVKTTAGVSETQVMESSSTFTETSETRTAQRVISVAQSVETTAVASCKKIDATEQVLEIEEKAVAVAPIQESVSVSEVQPEDVVKELAEKKPKSRRAKPEKKAAVKETARVTEVKTSVAEEIMRVEEVRMAREVEETMLSIRAQEFGAGESPLRELAKIGFLVRHGVSVNEITALYQADLFPALRTPQAQSALVQVVERRGYGTLVSQILTEESTMDETLFAATVGFRALMRMVELNYATVEEVITHFSPDDFGTHSWETTEASQSVTKQVSEQVEVSQRTEVQHQEKRKSVKKTKVVKTKLEAETEEAVSLSIQRESEVFEEVVREAVITEIHEGDMLFSICSYVAENVDAINLVEGERVYVLECHNSDWWFVKKHLTEEKGWVPAQFLKDEPSYTLYVQKTLHEKIDKLPVFEKPGVNEKVSAPRFTEKLQPKHSPDGATVQFECQVVGTPRPQVTWFRQTAIILPSADFQIFYDEDNVATLIIREVFPEDAGVFTCVAKNAAGFASSTTELHVEAPLSDHGSDITIPSRKSVSRESSLADILEGIPPMFSRKPKAVCVDEGTDLELECRLVAIPEPDVVWYCGGRQLTTGDNVTVATDSDMHMYCSVVRIKKVRRNQEGSYEVVAKNREGEASIEFTVKVRTGENEAPQVLEPLRSAVVCEGDSVVLSTHIVGTPAPVITWLRDGQPVTDLPTSVDKDTHTLTLIQPSQRDAGEYSVTAVNSVGRAETSASVVVQELPTLEPPMFVDRFQEQSVKNNGTVRLVAKVTGNPTPQIMWLRNNEPLKLRPTMKETFDGENIMLEMTAVDSEVDAGDYKCVASNPIGKTSHGARVTIEVDKVTFTRPLQKSVLVDEQSSLVLECETSHTVSTKWFHNGKEVSGMDHREVMQEGRTHRLVIKKTSNMDSGVYKCTVKKQATECSVTVKETKADFVRKLQDFEVKERECAILEVEITSVTADVTWHKDGEQIKDVRDKIVFEKSGNVRKLLIRGASVHDEGEYTCALGEQECTAEVTVVELPPEIIQKMCDVTIARGEKAMFEIELTKGDALVRWFKDGKELQFSEHVQLSIDGKRQRLKVYNSLPEDSGEYSCKVGEQTSTAKLTVEEPVVDFITRLPDVTLIPLNLDASFTVELSRPEVPVTWLKNGKELKPSDRHIITSEGAVRKLVVKKVTQDDQTEYTCVAINVKTSSKLKVEIIETAPKIHVEALVKEYRVKKGDDITMEVKYTSLPPPKDEWFVNGTLLKKSKRVIPTLGEHDASLTIKKVEEADIGSYKIRLANNCGEASAELNLVLMEVPSQPGSPEVVEVTNESITLHWKTPESDGNSPITNYILEYHDKGEISFSKVSGDVLIVETTHTVTQVQHNKEYMFKVSAVNAVGTSVPSNVTRYLKIAAPSSTEAPTITEPLKGVVTGLGQSVTLSCVVGGVPQPEVKWLRDGRVFKNKTMSYESRVAKYVITETTETTAGKYTCVAHNEAGEAETTAEVVVQDAPKLEVDESLATQKLRITGQWKVEVKFSGYPRPTVAWSKDGKDLTSTKHCSYHVDETSTTIAIYSLKKEDTAKYVVTARNSAGSASAELTLRVIDKPGKPEGPIVMKDIKKESVTIEWKPPADDGGLELSKYSVEKCDVGKMVWMKVADVEKDVSSYCVQQLTEDSEYMFRVIAENPVGSSEALESDSVTVRSKFDKPSPPQGPLDVSGMTKTSFTISWKPSKSNGGSPIIEYIVERREVGKKAWQKVGSTKPEDTHFMLQDLKTDASFHFRITARNEVGVSLPLAPEDPITAGKRISAPSAPTKLCVTDITSKSVTIQWGPPASTGGTELTGYVLEKRLSSENKWVKVVTLEPTITRHLIENLKDKSEYYFRAYAENSIGLSPPAGTELISLKTHATVPSPPSAPLESRAVNANSVIIEWGIPESDGGAPIQGYTIAIRDSKKTMWMEVGRVKADIQRLTIKDLQENHEYMIRIFARNEVGPSDPLESDDPFQMLRPDVMEAAEPENADVTTAPTLSFSTETTMSWMKEAGMDPDIHSYARGSLLRRDEYFFRIWYYARQLFK